jgi:hypothetical protein
VKAGVANANWYLLFLEFAINTKGTVVIDPLAANICANRSATKVIRIAVERWTAERLAYKAVFIAFALSVAPNPVSRAQCHARGNVSITNVPHSVDL